MGIDSVERESLWMKLFVWEVMAVTAMAVPEGSSLDAAIRVGGEVYIYTHGRGANLVCHLPAHIRKQLLLPI